MAHNGELTTSFLGMFSAAAGIRAGALAVEVQIVAPSLPYVSEVLFAVAGVGTVAGLAAASTAEQEIDSDRPEVTFVESVPPSIFANARTEILEH